MAHQQRVERKGVRCLAEHQGRSYALIGWNPPTDVLWFAQEMLAHKLPGQGLADEFDEWCLGYVRDCANKRYSAS